VQAQGGVVTGEASVPFYIVQPGDTLWQIAVTYGTKVDTLRAINKLGDDFIKPGQLLSLPQAGENTQAPGPVPDAPPPVKPSTSTDQGADNAPAPAMPSTGANARP
jgi:LysM repeat protein